MKITLKHYLIFSVYIKANSIDEAKEEFDQAECNFIFKTWRIRPDGLLYSGLYESISAPGLFYGAVFNNYSSNAGLFVKLHHFLYKAFAASAVYPYCSRTIEARIYKS